MHVDVVVFRLFGLAAGLKRPGSGELKTKNISTLLGLIDNKIYQFNKPTTIALILSTFKSCSIEIRFNVESLKSVKNY